MVRKLNFQCLFVCVLVVNELDLLNRFSGVGVVMGSGIKCLDLCAKWYVRDGEEFLDTRYNSEDEIDPEGFLHGRRIIIPSTLPNGEGYDDMLPQANAGVEGVPGLDLDVEETGSSISRPGGSNRERGHESTPCDMGGCLFSELIGDGTQAQVGVRNA